ncbi:hypothetical protein FLL45_21725 [Aliikangiella marina]|uniref:Lipoprotein n=1 Tax=Aliikangiella marina TaxID=1712262 RepID=A0A545T182_9GAMM|nr:DUF6491 family protein [Aliikangiella marina]TQV70949.1 hypothetical protein FLL45_21725 [Aliikangiella marina]
MKKLAISMMLVSVLAACASTPPPDYGALYQNYITKNKLESLKRISAFNYRGWRSLDNEHLIINASHNKPYLITLTSPCFDLRFSHAIAINSRGTSSLYTRSDSITVPNYPQQKCFIKTIHPLTKEQADEIVKLGKTSDKTDKKTS